MALEASPPVQELSQAQQARADQLEHDLERTEAEVESLKKRNAVLAGALLASSAVQSQLSDQLSSSTDDDLAQILDNRRQYIITNVHRMAFGVTSFAFTDITLDTPGEHLLGVRFDLHRRGGTTEAPYYIICKRSIHKDGPIEIHHHTIPAHIPLAHYHEQFLGLSDDGYVSEDGEASDYKLEILVHRVRTDLVAWRLRQDTIAAVQDKLGLAGEEDTSKSIREASSRCGIAAFDAVAEDALFVRIVWLNGRVGRIKLGMNLNVEQAVVFGSINGQEQRCADFEAALLGGDGQLDTVVDRLKLLSEID